MGIRRLWKPLLVQGMFLYRVEVVFRNAPQYDDAKMVFANSAGEAEQVVAGFYRYKTQNVDAPTYKARREMVYQPVSWQRY